MNKLHRQIIGICWLMLGALIFSLLVLKLESANSPVVAIGVFVGTVFLAGGFVLLANLRKVFWICYPCAALSLLTFPLGTVIGIYYLWYTFKSRQAGGKDA